MDYNRLALLRTAIDSGSLRRAATEIGISQPSLSAHIRKLEEDLDLILLHRSSSGVRPTVDAIELLPFIDALLAAQQQLVAQADQISAGDHRHVRVGAVSLFMLMLVPQLIAAAQTQHPKSRVEVMEAGSLRIADQVASRELDLGLIVRSPLVSKDYEELRYIDLASGSLHVCFAQGNQLAVNEAVTMDQLRGRPMIIHSDRTLLRQVFETFRARYDLVSQSTADSGPSVHRLVAGSTAIAFSSATDFAGPSDPTRVLYRPIVDPLVPLVLSIVVRRGERTTGIIASIIRLLHSPRSAFDWPPGFTPIRART